MFMTNTRLQTINHVHVGKKKHNGTGECLIGGSLFYHPEEDDTMDSVGILCLATGKTQPL